MRVSNDTDGRTHRTFGRQATHMAIVYPDETAMAAVERDHRIDIRAAAH